MPPEIIAEAAQGYEGKPDIAQKLVEAAVASKADAVKMQLVYADELATPDYQYYDLFKKLEMSDDTWASLIKTAHDGGLRFVFDIFGLHSLHVSLKIKADAVKVHSTDFLNHALLKRAFKEAPFVYVSLGGITLKELKAFIQRHKLTSKSKVCFLYGFQGDPTPLASNQLMRLKAWKEQFPGFRFGFMDHAEGTTPEAMTLSLLALPLGVNTIEKHITLDRALKLEDYISALTPEEFKAFVSQIRSLHQALGEASLAISKEEQSYRSKVIKVVVATRELRSGDKIDLDRVALKRSSKPLQKGSVYTLEDVLNKVIKSPLRAHEPLLKEMVK